MSSVVSFKVPREITEEMKKLENHIKWSEELRNFLIKRVEEVEREANMREVVEMLKKTRGVPKGYAVALVREDRDSS
jgi:DNA-binding transcriptional regulator GbsR (MarR family)